MTSKLSPSSSSDVSTSLFLIRVLYHNYLPLYFGSLAPLVIVSHPITKTDVGRWCPLVHSPSTLKLRINQVFQILSRQELFWCYCFHQLISLRFLEKIYASSLKE
jgi:hypothetical protein